MLLRGGNNLAVDDGIGQEAAARPAGVPVLVEGEQVQVPLDVQAAQRSGLGDRDSGDVLGGRGRDREVLQRPPEVARRVGVRLPFRIDVHAAVDVDVVGVLSQAGHVRVEAHVERDIVLARLEEQGIAFGAELVGFHLRKDVVGGFLDVGGRHFRVEHENVRAEDGGVRFGVAGEGSTEMTAHSAATATIAGTVKSVFRTIVQLLRGDSGQGCIAAVSWSQPCPVRKDLAGQASQAAGSPPQATFWRVGGSAMSGLPLFTLPRTVARWTQQADKKFPRREENSPGPD